MTYFFGYGSLVNSRTHIYDPVHPARAKGWRRAWCHTPSRQLAFLTAVPDPGCSIDGLMAPVGSDWGALDLREAAYQRLDATAQITHDARTDAQVAIYAIADDNRNAPHSDHPVLLSYLDVVLQGYLEVFGRSGADGFVATTSGWEAPILNDRARPQYPRSQQLSDADRAYVDATVATLGCQVLT